MKYYFQIKSKCHIWRAVKYRRFAKKQNTVSRFEWASFDMH